MPFYDDFDLSTVDVLLISQYVSTLALRASIEVGGARRITITAVVPAWRTILGPTSCISETMEYHLHSSPTPLMCLLTPAHPYIAA
jgi:hypothetical protein